VAEQAAELDPRNALAMLRIVRIYIPLRRYREAEDILADAIALIPDRDQGYIDRYWNLYSWGGPSDRSRQVLEAMPVGSAIWEYLWFLQEFGERDYEAALERLASFRTPVFEGRYFFFPKILGECQCYLRMDEPERAREPCEASLVALERAAERRPGHPSIRGTLGLAYAYLGRKEEAISEGERAVELLPVSRDAEAGPTQVTRLAQIYAQVGEPDAALDRIEYLLSIPSHLTVARLRLEPWWDPLRDHPRFAEILERYGEEE